MMVGAMIPICIYEMKQKNCFKDIMNKVSTLCDDLKQKTSTTNSQNAQNQN